MKEDGGPAFPQLDKEPIGTVRALAHGMSLRDWYAGMALQGLCSALRDESATFLTHKTKMAEACYEFADALLRQRQ